MRTIVGVGNYVYITILSIYYRSLYLSADKVIEGGCRRDILSNATITEEDYFVAPPGESKSQEMVISTLK